MNMKQHKILMFMFDWLKGSRNDTTIQEFKRRMIQYCYIDFQLHVKYGGQWLPVEYKKASSDNASTKWYAYMVY